MNNINKNIYISNLIFTFNKSNDVRGLQFFNDIIFNNENTKLFNKFYNYDNPTISNPILEIQENVNNNLNNLKNKINNKFHTLNYISENGNVKKEFLQFIYDIGRYHNFLLNNKKFL